MIKKTCTLISQIKQKKRKKKMRRIYDGKEVINGVVFIKEKERF